MTTRMYHPSLRPGYIEVDESQVAAHTTYGWVALAPGAEPPALPSGGGGLSAAELAASPELKAAYGAGGLAVTNLAGLSRWADARGNALVRPVTITVLGDSISWGVGSDDTNAVTDKATFRERAWPVQLRKRLNAAFGAVDGASWFGLASVFDAGATISGASPSTSQGPFGTLSGGGYAILNGNTITLPAASSGLGKFTEIDVWHWGAASGINTPAAPLVTIDGTARTAPSGQAAGNLLKSTVTGLGDTTHDVVLGISAADATAPRLVSTFAVTVRRDSKGFVVNRIAVPGAETKHVGGAFSGFSGTQVTRNLDAAIMRGYTDLLIVALGTNDQGSQVPLATYQANLQAIIDAQVAAGGCVLLLGEPPRPVPTGALTEDAYRAVMKTLAQAGTHVAYTDARDLYGDRSTLLSRGLIPVDGTVHPSAKGHGLLANAVTELLTLPRYA